LAGRQRAQSEFSAQQSVSLQSPAQQQEAGRFNLPLALPSPAIQQMAESCLYHAVAGGS
jgi:hypothetical protein